MKIQPFKWTALTLGTLLGVAHIGVIGHIIKPQTPEEPQIAQAPTINIPSGPYSSYKIRSGKDGYEIEYRANDPLILESEKSHDSASERRGLFGGGTQRRTEYRRDQYTMDGTRNIGGGIIDSEGKSAAEIECIVADAGSRSQGVMAGSALSAGLLAPAIINIPYIGWLAAGWATLLGQNIGSEIGSQVGSVFNDC